MNPSRQQTARIPLASLLASLVFVLVVAPQVEDQFVSGILFHGGLTAIFVTGVVANRSRRWIFWTGVAIATLAIPISWTSLVVESAEFDLGQYLIVIVFAGMTSLMLLATIVSHPMPPFQAILGLTCVYLLIGLTWAMIYSSIEYVDDESFEFASRRVAASIDSQHTAFSQLTYFSFVTMSTLGYGDISPRTPLAETACWLQSVVGQLFIAVLITRFVNEMPRRSQPNPAVSVAQAAGSSR